MAIRAPDGANNGHMKRSVPSYLNDTGGSFAGLKERSEPTEELLFVLCLKSLTILEILFLNGQVVLSIFPRY